MTQTMDDMTATVEQIDGVAHADAYPADNDLSQPDVIEVSGTFTHSEVMDLLTDMTEPDTTLLSVGGDAFLLYRSLGAIDEHDGSEFDILGYTESTIEAVLTERGPEEVAAVGDVFRFDRGETDFEITLSDQEDA